MSRIRVQVVQVVQVVQEEGGFFTRLAGGLGEAGVASLRFDLRGHGESEGRQEELTLFAILNDIRVALAYVREATGASHVSVLGASFSGGLCAYYAAKCPDEMTRLVLLNPRGERSQYGAVPDARGEVVLEQARIVDSYRVVGLPGRTVDVVHAWRR